MAIDYSKYGAIPDIDYSKYGATLDDQQPQMQSNPQQSFSYLGNSTNSISNLRNFGKGALDALSNTLVVDPLNIAGRLTGSQSLQNISQMQTGQGGAYTAGNIAGSVGAFAPLGVLGAGALGATEGLPLIGRLASALGGEGSLATALRQATGGAAYGALTNPQDTSSGAEKGAAISGALGAVPLVGSAYNAIKTAVNPQKVADNILDTLGQGRSLSENALSLGKDVVQKYKDLRDQGVSYFDRLFNNPGVADDSIYDKIAANTPVKGSLGETYLTKPTSYLDTVSTDNFSPKTSELHDKFVENPNLENAHWLQSSIGYDIRNSQKPMLQGPGAQNITQNLKNSQNQLNSDIDNYLNSSGNGLSDQYNAAKDFWQSKVVPFTSVPSTLRLIRASNANDRLLPSETNEEANELPDITKPDAIAGIFKNVNTQNSVPISQILQNMNPSFSNKVLYSELGKASSSKSPEALSKAFSNLDSKGLSSYVNPDIQQQASDLNSKILNKKGLQIGGGLLGAGLLGLHEGLGLFPEVASALGGAAATPYISQALGRVMPNIPTGTISNALGRVYRPASMAARSYLIPQSNQGNQQ